MKLRLLFSVVVLSLGLFANHAPSHRALADLAPCTNCGAQVDGGLGV